MERRNSCRTPIRPTLSILVPPARPVIFMSRRTAIPRAKRGQSNFAAGCIVDSTATLQYTFAKAIDDDAVLGGAGAVTNSSPSASIGPAGAGPSAPSTPRGLLVAQNWLDLSARNGVFQLSIKGISSVRPNSTTPRAWSAGGRGAVERLAGARTVPKAGCLPLQSRPVADCHLRLCTWRRNKALV